MKEGRVQTAGKLGDTSPRELEEIDERDGDNIDEVDIQL